MTPTPEDMETALDIVVNMEWVHVPLSDKEAIAQRIAAALAERREKDAGIGWPIEEAPKDGTEILAWTPEGFDICWHEEKDPDQMDHMGSDAGWWGKSFNTIPGRSFGNPDYFREPQNQPLRWWPLPSEGALLEWLEQQESTEGE